MKSLHSHQMQMAKNVAVLKHPQVKKKQVKRLTNSLIAMLKESKK